MQMKTTWGAVGWAAGVTYRPGMGKPKKKRPLRYLPLALDFGPHLERLKLSQAQLGEKLGVSDASINRIMLGKQNWNQEFLQHAADVLGCHWADLLPLEGDRAKVRELVNWLGSSLPIASSR